MEKKSIISNVGRKGSFLHMTVDRVYIEYINLWRTDKESNIYKLYSTLISLTYVCSMSKNTSITNTFNTIGRLNPTPPPPHPSPLPIRSLSRFPKLKSLDGMLVHRQVTTQLFIRLPWPLAGTWVERSTVRVKYLAKEHNTVTWPGVKKQNTNIKNWTLRISELNLANSCIIFN